MIFQELNRIPEPPESWAPLPPPSSAPFRKRTHSPCVSSVHDINHRTSDQQPVSKTPRVPSAQKRGQPRLPKALIRPANIRILSMCLLKSTAHIFVHLACPIQTAPLGMWAHGFFTWSLGSSSARQIQDHGSMHPAESVGLPGRVSRWADYFWIQLLVLCVASVSSGV